MSEEKEVKQEVEALEQAAPPTAETAEETSAKEAIYIKIDAYVKNKLGKRIGKTGGREIFDLVVGEIFAAAVANSTLRFNGGFGSLHVKQYQAGERRLPSGQITKFDVREKVRYEEGVVVKKLVENGGDLAKAIEEGRGKRGAAKPEAPAPVNEPVAQATAPAATEEAEADVDLS